MKSRSLLRAFSVAAAASLAATALAVFGATPASATQSTLTILSTGDITSLNSGTTAGNTAYNSRATYPTGAGFAYYDEDTNLIMNTKFGKMSIAKNTPTLFQLKYAVTKGQTWSDGTPIDAVDLLLSHVVAADDYSKSAGLGDPSVEATDFNSVSYGSSYGQHVIGLPTLSADKYTLTVSYDQPMVDWQLLAPGPSAVHALSLLADNTTVAQAKALTAADRLAAKAKFLSAFTTKNTVQLRNMGEVWSNDFNLANICTVASDCSARGISETNPLYLLSNGGFIVSSKKDGDSLTLVRNAKYKSGPAFVKTTAPVNTIVFKIIKSDSAAVLALQNKNIDLYTNTLASSANKIALTGTPGVTTLTKVGGNYSVLGLRTGAVPDSEEPYTGKFFGNGNRAKDLRHAFLLALPREQMVDNLVRTVNPSATVMDTNFAFTGTSEYRAITAATGVAEYSAGTQATRTAAALALVKKWYPTASATNNIVTIKVAHANTGLRNNIANLLKAEEEKAGFNIVDYASDDLFSDSDGGNDGVPDFYDPQYDVTFHGFSITAVTQGTATAQFQSDGGNNEWGYQNAKVDILADQLQSDVLTAAQVTAKRIAIDKIVHDSYWGLPLYQNPTLTAYNSAVANVKPQPIGYDVVWNYWEWHF